MTIGDDGALNHQLQSRMTQLKILCVTWQVKIRAIPCAHDVGASWGPSDDILADIAASEVTGQWDDQDNSLSTANLIDSTDSDVSDFADDDSDDLLDGYEGTGDDDSDLTENFASPLDRISVLPLKRVRM
jgi:hypothetical protein